LCDIASEYNCTARTKSWAYQTDTTESGSARKRYGLRPSIHVKALLASALSREASCLSFSGISLGSVKLSVDNAGDGIDDGGVVEGRDDEDEDRDGSLMINEYLIFCY
jgi:hypothetical protein